MSTKLPYPSNAGHYGLFRNRIRQSLPNGPVTAKWLQTALAIPSEPNARVLFSALRDVGFLKDDGALSERGMALRDSEQSEAYRRATLEAAEQALGEECVASIRAEIITGDTLPGYLLSHTGQGESAVGKAIAGIRWLAEQSGDEVLISALRAKRGPRKIAEPKPRSRPVIKQVSPLHEANSPVPGVATDGGNHQTTPVPETNFESGEASAYRSFLLESGALKVVIDSGRSIEEAQKLIHMMQRVERGERVPALEEAVDDSE